jgi:hypothetical protein
MKPGGCHEPLCASTLRDHAATGCGGAAACPSGGVRCFIRHHWQTGPPANCEAGPPADANQRSLPWTANAGDAGVDQGRARGAGAASNVRGHEPDRERCAAFDPIPSVSWKLITARLCNGCHERGHNGRGRASEADSRDVVPRSKVGPASHGEIGRRRGWKPAIASLWAPAARWCLHIHRLGPASCGAFSL